MFPDRTLIIGCGAVDSSRGAAPNNQKIAIDLNFGIIKEFHSRNPEILAICADATQLPFANQSIGRTEATHVLEHLGHRQSQSAVNEIERVSMKGGEVVISVPHPTYDNLLATIDPAHHSEVMHQQVFKGDDLTKLVINSGLNIISQKSQNWQQAIKLLIIATIHRLNPNIINRHDQIGYVATDNSERLISLKNFGKKALSLLNKLSPILDKIIPYENIIYARK